MRLISSIALVAALMSSLLLPVAAAPISQTADARAILEASGGAMDSAQSMGFSGAMDVRVSMGSSATTTRMPMSGAYQAPDRMTMSVQMPDQGTSMDVIMVGGEVWTRKGRGDWTASPSSEGVYASAVGKSHVDWFRGFTEPVATDLGAAYRITSSMDVSNALNVGPSSVLGSGSMPFDLTAASAQVALTIDKSTSYMVSMQLELLMPLKNGSGNVAITMNTSFSDFNSVAVEIVPPV